MAKHTIDRRCAIEQFERLATWGRKFIFSRVDGGIYATLIHPLKVKRDDYSLAKRDLIGLGI